MGEGDSPRARQAEVDENVVAIAHLDLTSYCAPDMVFEPGGSAEQPVVGPRRMEVAL